MGKSDRNILFREKPLVKYCWQLFRKKVILKGREIILGKMIFEELVAENIYC